MNAAAKRSCLVGMGIFVVFSGQPAQAAEGPLLVVVEAPPALDADAAEIRRAIGAELRSETVAPMRTTGEPPGRALIVALNHERIAMSLRTGDGSPVVRAIPAPPEHAARLRAIAWLAGNLARDQVSPIVAEALPEAPASTTDSPAANTSDAPEPPRPPSYAATEPPPLSADQTIVRHSEGKHSDPPRWSIGIAYGPAIYFPVHDSGVPGSAGGPDLSLQNPFAGGFWDGVEASAWRIELQRRPKRDGLLLGAAVEGTTGGYAPQVLGANAFVGSAKHLGRWSFEPTIGAGLELANAREATFASTYSSASGFMSVETVTDGIRPALYAEGAIALAHPVSDSLDAVLRLGAHATAIGIYDWFLSATLGLRYNL